MPKRCGFEAFINPAERIFLNFHSTLFVKAFHCSNSLFTFSFSVKLGHGFLKSSRK